MAKQDLSRHQQKIVSRYYDNLDTIVATRLQEMVSDLYLAEGEKKAATLWKKVKTLLDKTPVNPQKVGQIIESRDIQAFAALVNQLVAGKVLRED